MNHHLCRKNYHIMGLCLLIGFCANPASVPLYAQNLVGNDGSARSTDQVRCSNLRKYNRSIHRIDLLDRGFSFQVPDGWDVLEFPGKDSAWYQREINGSTLIRLAPVSDIRHIWCAYEFEQLGLSWPPPGVSRGGGFAGIDVSSDSPETKYLRPIRSLATPSGVYRIYEFTGGTSFYVTEVRSSTGVISYVTADETETLDELLRSIVIR